MEDHDGSAVHDEAHLAPEGVVQPLGEIGERPREYLAGERNVVHVFQTRNHRRRRRFRHCCLYGHMHEGHDGGRDRCRCPHGYGLGESVERHFWNGLGVRGCRS